MKIKISDIKKAKPCKDRWNEFNSQTKIYQRLTTIEEIVNFNGVSDSLWVIRNVLKDKIALVELARQFADSVEHLDNFSSRRAARAARAPVAIYAGAVAADARDAVRDATTGADVAERKKQKQMIINYYKDK